jgi:tryptophan-rich sensory protein
METAQWYQNLIRPDWAPPAWLFGPVWTVLYIIIGISYGYVVYLFTKKRIPFLVVVPFLLNLIFNIAFSPIQFGLQNNVLALIDIVLVDITLIWALFAIYKHARWVALVNVPYLLWCLFATILQITITILN